MLLFCKSKIISEYKDLNCVGLQERAQISSLTLECAEARQPHFHGALTRLIIDMMKMLQIEISEHERNMQEITEHF